jgi:hypothetical protein
MDLLRFLMYFRPHYGPEDDSTSIRNEYQKSSLRGKDGWYVVLTSAD